MFTVRKYIIGLLLGTMMFSGIAIVDEVIVKLSLAVASAVAFSVVGTLYSTGIITSKVEGGKARLYIFIPLLAFFIYIFTQIAKGIIWLFSFSLWVYIVILMVSVALIIIIMMYKNKKVIKLYKVNNNKQNIDDKEIRTDNVQTTYPEILNNQVELKKINELLMEEKEKDYIKAYHNNPNSPGLEYVQVYKKSLDFDTVKGYIKMDNAAAFWGDVYYAYDKRWIKFS